MLLLLEALAILVLAALGISIHASLNGRPVRFALQDLNAWFVAVLTSAFFIAIYEMVTGPLN